MPDLDLLRYRPELMPPQSERPTADLPVEVGIPEADLPLPSLPPVALDLIASLPEGDQVAALNAMQAEVAALRAGLVSASPIFAGITPSDYLSASPAEAAKFEAAAIEDGTSAAALALPILRDLVESVDEAVLLAQDIAPLLPPTVGARRKLSAHLQAAERAEATTFVAELSVVQALSQLVGGLGGVVSSIRSLASSAPGDLLGADPAAAITALAADTESRTALQASADDARIDAVAACLSALRRRKRVNVAPVLRRLRTMMPDALRRRRNLVKLAQRAMTNRQIATVALPALERSGGVFDALQTAIGDLSRVGALMGLEWHEYTEAGRNRFLLAHMNSIVRRCEKAAGHDVREWISRQGDLFRRAI